MDIEKFGYKILSNGDVISKRTGEPMKFSDNGKGYMISCISVDSVSISITHHRVVAYKFLGECPEGFEVGHRDDVRCNNHPDNLEYVTKSENNKQSYTRDNRSAKGANNANSKLTEDDVRRICRHFEINKSSNINISKMSRDWSIARMTLCKIKGRKQWTEISSEYEF